MSISDQTVSDFTLPSIDVRGLVRRAALPAVIGGALAATLIVLGGRMPAVAAVLRRAVRVSPGWVGLGIALEALSLAGYVALLSLVAGRATPRVRFRESAQITLAGAAATRLLPTAGAGGAALALWTLRRAGLASREAARTLLAFLVVLYSVFLTSIVASGALLGLGVVKSRGAAALGAVPAAGALLAIVVCLMMARASRAERADLSPSRLKRSGHLIGLAVRDACRLVRSGDVRLIGAVAYWLLDAGVLWATLHAFGAPPALPALALAYFVGQVANTLPLPGSVSGGIAGVLIAFGVPAELALPAVLAYRTVAVWLPTPVAIAAIPGLRATVTRWEREDVPACAGRCPGSAASPLELSAA